MTVAPLSVTVSDDGVGPGDGTLAEGNGLRGLRERAAAVGARLVVGAAPPQGFSLAVSAVEAPVPGRGPHPVPGSWAAGAGEFRS